MTDDVEQIASALTDVPAAQPGPAKMGWLPNAEYPAHGLMVFGDARDRAPSAFRCGGCGDVFREADSLQLPPWRAPDGTYWAAGSYPTGPRTNAAAGLVLCEACYRQGNYTSSATVRAAVIDVPAAYLMADVDGLEASVRVDGKARALRSRVKAWPGTLPQLCVRGGVGAGKTWICWCALKALAQRGRVGEYRTWAGLHTLWHGAFVGQGRERLIQRLTSTRWLVLDDLSASEMSPGWAEFVHAVIDARLSGKLPTIITTACDGPEIERVYGRAIRSRLASMSWIVLGDTDRRQHE